MNNVVISKISLILFIIAAIIFGYFALMKIIIILLPFIFGWLLSKPIYQVINKLKIQHSLLKNIVILVIIIAILSVISGIIYLIGNTIVNYFIDFSNHLPQLKILFTQYLEAIRDNLDNLDLIESSNFYKTLSDTLTNIISNLSTKLSSLFGNVFNFVVFLPRILIFIVFTILATFFMTKDHQLIEKKFRPFFKNKILDNKYIHVVRTEIFSVLFAYLKAQGILMLIAFIESSIGLSLIGVKYALLIALIVSLVDALPFLGPATIYMPWIISKVILKDYTFALYLFILYLVVTLMRQFIEPRLISFQIGIYPLVTLASIYAGLQIFGFIGVIIGPILIISSLTIYKTYQLEQEFESKK